MKNIRKFKMAADKEAAVIEEYSVSYVTENDKVYTTPENGGQSNGDIKNYMRFVAVEDSQINLTSINPNTGEADNSVDLKHSKDGLTWTQYDFTPIPLAAGETLYLKGNNENGFTNEPRLCTFGDVMGSDNGSTGKFECHGNIMSLLYGDDFEDKTTIPSAGCYANLFGGCTSLTTAPELPATTLADSCYLAMFNGCTSLTTAPELPATTLADRCYVGMFNGCTSLTTAPELPATTLANSCYYQMFKDCTSLTTAPELPATTLTVICYAEMFHGCKSLTTAPELPATTLADRCYDGIFYYCTSLTTAPELPATTLADNCYSWMFYNCTNLKTAPDLPATTLANGCYFSMFFACTSLTTAPVLPATILVEKCYYQMFCRSTNLNHITMLATDISASSCLQSWVKNVSSTGTFVKHPDITSLPTGISGIPNGWTVEDAVI